MDCATPAVRDLFLTGGSGETTEIDAIAFGSDADQNLLQEIALKTGGKFYAVDATPLAGEEAELEAMLMSSAASGSNSLTPNELHAPNRLADAYRSIHERIHEQDRLFSRRDNLAESAPVLFSIEVTEADGGGVTSGMFAFNWHLQAASVTVDLRDASGTLVTASTPGWQVRRDTTHVVYTYDGVLAPGVYEIELVSDIPVQVVSTLSGRIQRGVDLGLTISPLRSARPQVTCSALPPVLPKFLRGIPVKLSANILDNVGGIDGVDVIATVTNANGSVNRVVLYDDGSHGDEYAEDGIYTALYPKTPFATYGGVTDLPPAPPSGTWGSAHVLIEASGASNFDEPFQRSEQGSFAVLELAPFCAADLDGDGDGLPTRWETYYGMNPVNAADALVDEDFDGLLPLEEFKNGTDSKNPDSDGGGEADGSEVFGGRDPLFEVDDLLPRMFDFGIVNTLIHIPLYRPEPNTNILHFPVNPAYRRMEIYRKQGLMPFARLANLDLVANPSGVYYDRHLTNGVKYHYFLVARGESGSATPRTATFAGTPKADPLAPEGWITIDNGASKSDSLPVLLGLDDSDAPTQVRVSENPDFAGAAWQAMATSLPFNLADQGPAPWVATVWVEYRDAALNVSPTEQASIIVDINGDEDLDSIQNLFDPDDDGDGITDFDEINRFRTDPFEANTDVPSIRFPVPALRAAPLATLARLPPRPEARSPAAKREPNASLDLRESSIRMGVD